MQKGFAWNLQNLCLCVSKYPPALCGFLCIQTTGSPKAAEYRDLFLVHMSILNLAKDPCLLFEYEIPYHIKTEQFLLLDYIYIFLIKGHWTANMQVTSSETAMSHRTPTPTQSQIQLQFGWNATLCPCKEHLCTTTQKADRKLYFCLSVGTTQ